MADKKTAYDKVTEALVARLQQGEIPWRRPWALASSAPANLASGRAYTGFINCLLLSSGGHSSRYWATYNQIRQLGGTVKKGSKGTPVAFWKILEREDRKDPAKIQKIPMLRSWTVFNVDQTEGLEENRRVVAEREALALPPKSHTEATAEFMQMVEAYVKTGPSLTHGGNAAYYVPALDGITMPDQDRFHSIEHYAAVLAHELTHSTGHRKRLAREGVTNHARFGSHLYSREELVAEMGSAFLAGICGFHTEDVFTSNVAYLQNWSKKLQGEPDLIVKAASEAQKAVDLILRASGRSRTAEEPEAEEEAA